MALAQPKPMSDDEWQLAATQAAIAACRDVVGKDGINGRSMISSLGDVEWGWIVAAAVFAWIKTRAQQAVAEGTSPELTIRNATFREPAPWEAGAIETILPQLGNMKDVNWSKPVGEWSKSEIVSFAWQIYKLSDGAIAARDECAVGKIASISKERSERMISAKNGGGYLSRGELNDDIPF